MRKFTKESKDKLFNFRPLFFGAVTLCLGIVFGYYRLCNGVSALWLLLLVPVATTPFFFCRTKKELLQRGVAVILLLAVYFMGITCFDSQVHSHREAPYFSGEYYVTGKVVKRKAYDKSVQVVLEDVFIDGKEAEGQLNAYLPLSFFENVTLCDEVLLYGNVETDTELFDEYGFRSTAIDSGLRYRMTAEEVTVTGRAFDLFLRVRARMEQVAYRGMDEENAAVTVAFLTGDTTAMDEGLLENMQYGGIGHIFAVSGMNVAVLCAFCLLFFEKTKLSKLPTGVRFVVVAGLLIFYTGICGFTASVVRATIMCLTAYAVRLFGSTVDSLETLGLSAIMILLISPILLFSVGFQLSFMACIGILFLSKGIGQVCDQFGKGYRKLFPRKLTPSQEKMLVEGDTLPPSVLDRIGRWISSTIAVTLAAQVATLPILLSAFGYVSGWSLVLNVVYVPLISGLFGIFLLIVCIACLLPLGITPYLLYAPNVLWSLGLLVFEGMDFSASLLVTLPYVPPSAQVAYLGGCTFLSDKWNCPKSLRYGCAIACFLSVLLILHIGNL